MRVKAKESEIKPISHSNNMCSHGLGKKCLDILLSAGTLISSGTQKTFSLLFKVLIDYVKYFQILAH